MSQQTLQHVLGHQPATPAIPNQTRLQNTLHAPHDVARTRVIDALATSPDPTHRKWATRLSECGNHASFWIRPTRGTVSPWISRCGHRLCPFCARARSAHVAAQLEAVIRAMARPRLLVLTVRSDDSPLDEQMRNIRWWFQKLRKRKAWTHYVDGGAYTVEVTQNKTTGRWHPHLHIVFSGRYLPQQLLRKLWHDVTGDSDIVHLQVVHNPEGAAQELAKYIGKPQRLASLSTRSLREYASAIQGNRMVQSFGTSYGNPLTDSDQVEQPDPDAFRVGLGKLIVLARRGFDTPMELLELLAVRFPVFKPHIYKNLHTSKPPETSTSRAARLAQFVHSSGIAAGPPDRGDAPDAVLKAAIFIRFTKYRQEDEAGDYIPRWSSTFT